MRFTFEEQSTANEHIKPSNFSFAYTTANYSATVTHQGRLYKKVGFTERDLSQSERFVCLLKLIGTFALGLLGCCLPFLDWNFLDRLGTLNTEVSSGKMRTIHCIPKTTAEQQDAIQTEEINMSLDKLARQFKSE
ncbi:MAG: hypothetical protein H0W88_10230 [Parachlamydiaceae bacterium]|nr:hypothetical protein [Parachlamydiaceae bacterium]